MAFENDLRRRAGILGDSASKAKNERIRTRYFVESSNRWWKGKGGEAFASEYKEIDSEVSRFIRSVDEAMSGMYRLQTLILKAEAERRVKAALEATKKV